MMEAVSTSEKSVNLFETTRCNTPEDSLSPNQIKPGARLFNSISNKLSPSEEKVAGS
jgi:hypothetical protein